MASAADVTFPLPGPPLRIEGLVSAAGPEGNSQDPGFVGHEEACMGNQASVPEKVYKSAKQNDVLSLKVPACRQLQR